MKKLISLFVVFLFYSCKTSDFVGIENLAELNGRYYSKSIFKENKVSHEKTQAHMMLLFNSKETLNPIYYVDLNFQEPNKVSLTYPIIEEDSLSTRTINLEGKRKKKYLKITFYKRSIIIPFIFEDTDANELKIGKNKAGELLLEKYVENSGGILFLGGGYAFTSSFVFHPYKQYEDLKPFYKDGKWGILKKGKVIVEPKYEGTNIFKQNYIKVKKNGYWGLLDERGNEIIPIIYDDILDINDEGVFMFYVKKGESIGMVNSLGKEIIPPKYEMISRYYDVVSGYSDNLFKFYKNGKVGIADNEKIIFPAIYTHFWGLSPEFNRFDKSIHIDKKYFQAKRNGVDYILDKEGYEYKPNRKIPTFVFGQSVYPLLETARKVELNEEE